MLTTLRIKNLALVADLTLELPAGLNVITGETGAGKSILIGALSLVLGERADRTLLRAGADTCVVEAVFDVRNLRAPLAAFLEENGLEPCEGGQLVLKRSFTAAGANRQFINGSPATLQALARVGEWLVDIHGPHEHQSLLHAPRQLDILDAFGRLQEPRAQFAGRVRRRADLEAQKAALVVDDQTYARQLDLLRFQVREIREANLRADEVEALEQDHRRVTNSARLVELSRGGLALLGDEEDALPSKLGALGRLLQDLQRLDPAAAGLAEVHGRAAEAVQDLHAQLSRYADHLDLDPAVLQDLEVRLDLIHSLQRKYGGSVPAVIAFGEEAARQLDSLEQRDTELARLNGELAVLDAELLRLGKDLTAKRRKLLPQLGKAVARQLADLGFKQSQFDVALATQVPEAGARAPLNPSGFDTIEFQFAPNPGEPPRPLRAIASSGELARVMLALKTVLAAEDEIPVLIFDEVDANVGGETARAVGEKMRQIARQRQVLCITHLAPVAAQGDVHFVVAKETRAGRTTSEINRLEAKERVTELARMLGGQTEAARRHAAALLKEA